MLENQHDAAQGAAQQPALGVREPVGGVSDRIRARVRVRVRSMVRVRVGVRVRVRVLVRCASLATAMWSAVRPTDSVSSTEAPAHRSS